MKLQPSSPSWKTEAIAGLTTFFTMAYIVVVNPAILSTPGTGIPFQGALTATVLLCFTMTLLMGLYAKLPFAVGPGMGINAFFTFSLILGRKVPWETALAMVFWAGVIFLLISVTPLREKVARAIPTNLRVASAAGIGIFLTFIGLKNLGLVVADPVTFVKLGGLNIRLLVSLVGMAFMVWGMGKKSPVAFLGGMVAITLVYWAMGWVEAPKEWVSLPDFQSVFLKLDFVGALKFALLPAMISILFTDFFDSISTFIGVAQAGGLTESNGQPQRLREGLIVDAWATLTAGLFGTSSGTAFIESAAGVEAGGRTGRAAIVTALCFLPCFFIGPWVAMIPAMATAPVLILVGALMFRSVKELDLKQIEDVVPAFLTVILIPLTFSITQGILWGFISHSVLYFLAGRRREVSPTLWVVSGICVGLLWLEHSAVS